MSIGLNRILDTMASALSAESIRLNTTASNLANAGNIGRSEESTYRAKHPVFAEINQNTLASGLKGGQPVSGVQVTDILTSKAPLEWRYEPDNPLADEKGRIYITDVNPIEEMMNMIAASKEYQSSIEVMNTTKSLLLQTIQAMNS
ncbi:flagellar basal body rod protein FlgC [Legionella nagasakiensis]|uniref:flagellar basal body rod protein FlgC n=1 Tax=Legionella nagasakiensis TaxID=535290 RepID=UPI0010558C8C|nr:flagellar basal body rod protein FlgC [Legionella nagasakiensis]